MTLTGGELHGLTQPPVCQVSSNKRSDYRPLVRENIHCPSNKRPLYYNHKKRNKYFHHGMRWFDSGEVNYFLLEVPLFEGAYAGLVGLYAGLVGEYAGLVGE